MCENEDYRRMEGRKPELRVVAYDGHGYCYHWQLPAIAHRPCSPPLPSIYSSYSIFLQSIPPTVQGLSFGVKQQLRYTDTTYDYSI